MKRRLAIAILAAAMLLPALAVSRGTAADSCDACLQQAISASDAAHLACRNAGWPFEQCDALGRAVACIYMQSNCSPCAAAVAVCNAN